MDTQHKDIGPEGIKAMWNEAENIFVKKDGDKQLSDVNFTVDYETKLKSLTKDYEELDNPPAIDGVKLNKETTWDDLGLDIKLREYLNTFNPSVKTKVSISYNSDVFAEGTKAELFTVNHMTTVRLKIVIVSNPNPAITNDTPIRIFTENLVPASDDEWRHLGRYTDAENVAIEFYVDNTGIFYMISSGQIPSDRTYEVCFTYISA